MNASAAPPPERDTTPPRAPGSAGEVAAAFLKLGLSSFGGPIAHLGYFRREFVERRHWLDEARFAQLLALCQSLPGPASSQLGFSLGLLRAGWPGAIAAFLAFTLPSALLLLAFAAASSLLAGTMAQHASHGLKLLAVAVVAQAVVGMARALAPDLRRALIAIAATAWMLVAGNAWTQLLLIAVAALAGTWLCRGVTVTPADDLRLPYGRRIGVILLLLFAGLLLAAVFLAPALSPSWQLAAAFYRSGALVFGGGHVVLPLLQESVVTPGWLDTSTFMTGYGAAQAVPGPMFSLAAFLGAKAQGGMGGSVGATIALLAIFLPGLLLLAGSLPFWRMLTAKAWALRAIAGVNAAVVGLLAAALYDPVWTSAVRGIGDAVIAVLAFAALLRPRIPVIAVVLFCVAAAVMLGMRPQ